MTTDDPIILEQRLLGRTRQDRLDAVEPVAALPEQHAVPLLARGTEHWDRTLRARCIEKLIERQGEGALPRLREMYRARLLSLTRAVDLAVAAPTPGFIRAALTAAADEESGWFDYVVARALREDDDAEPIIRQLGLDRRDAFVGKERAKDSARAERLRMVDFSGLERALEMANHTLGLLFTEWVYDHDCFSGYYTVSRIAKRHGGFREISAPEGRLAHVQRAVLDRLLAPVPLSDACHGFRREHSTSSNAAPHVGQEMVINLDLRDFFPTITSGRVAGLFRQLDLPGGTMGRAFLVDAVTFRGRLPQGAPTSPAIANLVCRRLDSRLAGLARCAGAGYTRYADDLTFSGPAEIASLLPAARRIVDDEGFVVAKEKTRLMRRGSRQDVTGLTVNQQVSVPRAIRRRLRAAVHAVSHGRRPSWKGAPLSMDQLRGHLAYLRSVHPAEADLLLAKIGPTGA